MDKASILKQNLDSVRQRIAVAAARSGRTADAVRLIAVTKYVGADVTRQLVELGCHDLGESRPQVLWDKAPRLQDLDIHWHMIGHLQRNKVRRTLLFAPTIHSIDSQRLAQTLDATAAETRQSVTALVEVNISGEANKHGFSIEETPQAVGAMLELPHLKLVGFMGMASLAGSSTDHRLQFRQLRELSEHCRATLAGADGLTELSMGMSHDFEIAIEEGATMVRIGSSLFEGMLT